MAKMKDLTGKRFGLWTVLGFDKVVSGNYHWVCVCDCGSINSIASNSLKAGTSTRCKICSGLIKDLTNKSFGRLTVVRRVVSKTKRRGSNWLCQCECGNTVIKAAIFLTEGKTKSCGCLVSELRDTQSFDGTNIPLIRNKKLNKNNTSGVKGVWRHSGGRWEAHIQFKGKCYRLGSFEDIRDASKIRKQAEEKMFGEFLEWYDKTFPNKELKEVR